MSDEKIEVSLGKNGGKKMFYDRAEVTNWLNEEKGFWAWLQNPPFNNIKQTVNSQYINFFNNLAAQLQQGHLNNISSLFTQHFDQLRAIYSGTPIAKFIQKIREVEGDVVACASIAFVMRQPMNMNDQANFRGAQFAFSFEAGLQERLPSEGAALERLRLDWEARFQTLKESLQGESNTYNRLNLEARNWLDTEGTRFKGAAEKQAGEASQFVADAKKQWQELRKTYDESLALRSPVTYWTKKARSHLCLSWIFGIVSMGVAGASLYLMVPAVKGMIEVPKGTPDPEKWHPEYWRLIILTASALFCVWVIRIFVRLFLSHVHLLTDANERVVMTKTYLALLRRGKLKDDQALYILQTLFRPSQTGLVSDDAVPLTFVEAITKLKN